MPRIAPVHPSKLTGAARALYVDTSRERVSLDVLRFAKIGSNVKLVIDYGYAYTLLVTGKAPRRGEHQSKRTEVVCRLERRQIFGSTSQPFDCKVFGQATWPGYSAPFEIRLTHNDKQRTILIGGPDERGGMLEDWFIGQIGDMLSATLDPVEPS